MAGELLKVYTPEEIDRVWGKHVEAEYNTDIYPSDYLQKLREALSVVHYDQGTKIFTGEELPGKSHLVLAGMVQAIEVKVTTHFAGEGTYFGRDIVIPDIEQWMYQAIVTSPRGTDLLIVPPDQTVFNPEELSIISQNRRDSLRRRYQ